MQPRTLAVLADSVVAPVHQTHVRVSLMVSFHNPQTCHVLRFSTTNWIYCHNNIVCHMTLQCQDMLCLTSCAGEQLVSTAQLSTRLKHFGKGQIGKPLGLWHVIPVSKNSQATQSWHAFSE